MGDSLGTFYFSSKCWNSISSSGGILHSHMEPSRYRKTYINSCHSLSTQIDTDIINRYNNHTKLASHCKGYCTLKPISEKMVPASLEYSIYPWKETWNRSRNSSLMFMSFLHNYYGRNTYRALRQWNLSFINILLQKFRRGHKFSFLARKLLNILCSLEG